MSRSLVLGFVMVQAIISTMRHPVLRPPLGRDRPAPLTAIGCMLMLVLPFIYFGMLDTRNIWLVFIAIALGLPSQDLQYGPQAAYIAERFPGTLRYSGASLGYQLASLTAGGPAPLIALYLFQPFQTSMAVAAYVSVTAMVSLVCVWLLKDADPSLDHQVGHRRAHASGPRRPSPAALYCGDGSAKSDMSRTQRQRRREVVVTGAGVLCHMGDDLPDARGHAA